MVALVVAIDRPQHRGPRLPDGEEPAAAERYRVALLVDHVGLDAGERQRGRARLGRDRAGQRGDHDAAGLGLPPGVDDRAALAADHFVVPHPGFGIDRLADRAQQPQRGEVVACSDARRPT